MNAVCDHCHEAATLKVVVERVDIRSATPHGERRTTMLDVFFCAACFAHVNVGVTLKNTGDSASAAAYLRSRFPG